MKAEEAYRLRLKMVREQIEARGVRDPTVLSAMRTVPRHEFVPEDQRKQAYHDVPLPLGDGQTISQPYIVAYMTELLGVGAGDRVLEVGAGSGYQCAVLAEVASEVYGIERLETLATPATDRLETLRYRNVSIRCGDGALGWPEEAPFDGILVACGAPVVPTALLAQLAPGKRLVIPVGKPGRVMKLQVWTRSETNTWSHETVLDVRFVPLVSASDT